jgi:hypothetical protein
LSSTFITSGEFDSYVVVGTGGSSNVLGFARDVAGAVVVASAFAQQATTSTATEGTATVSRNLTTGYLDSTSVVEQLPLNSGRCNYSSWVQASDGFDWLVNGTVTNASNDEIANQTANLSVASQGIRTNSLGKVRLYDNAIIYNLSYSSSLTNVNGVGKNSSALELPDGNTYKITEWKSNSGGTQVNITLGDFEEINTSLNSVEGIGSTGASFEVIDARTTPSNAIKIRVKDSSDAEVFNDWVQEGNEIYSNDDFTLNLVSYSVSALDNDVSATVEWSTSATTLVEGEAAPTTITSDGANWTVDITLAAGLTNYHTGNNSNNITSIAWKFNAPGSYIDIDPGTILQLFDGYFKVTAEDLVINSSDKKETSIVVQSVGSGREDVSFVDENGTTHSFDMSPLSASISTSSTVAENVTDGIDWYLGNSTLSVTLACLTDGSTIRLTDLGTNAFVDINNGGYFTLNKSENISLPFEVKAMAVANGTECSAAEFNLSVVNWTSDGGAAIGGNLTFVGANTSVPMTSDFTDGYLNISEPDNNNVRVTFDNGTIDSVTYSGQAGEILSSVGDYYYTAHGTKLLKDSSTQITVTYPDAPKRVKVAVGKTGKQNYELTAQGYNEDLDITLESSAGSSVSLNKIDVGLAKLDTEIDTASLSKPIVLIGGSAVNTVVEALVTAGKVDFSNVTDDRALVQLVDDAFNSQSALVIAGYAGKDTRLAAQVIASQVLGTDMGLSGYSSAILNTAGETVSGVSVV